MRADSLARLLGAAVITVVALVWGCADFEIPIDPTGGLPDVEIANPSFSSDIQPIFTKRCSIGGCHSLASRQSELVLVAGYAYDSLVNQQSSLAPTFDLVVPGDAANSWLVRMIGPDDAARFSNARMPLAGQPLTENQIATIVNWIENGAPRN
jgi:hypothetical protein